jgi:uncharacterized protein
MNRFLPFAVAFVLILPLVARADDASRHAKAEQMVTLAHVDRLNNQVLDTILQQTAAIATQNAGGSLTPDKKAALDAFQKKLVALLEPQIGWKAMEPAFADIYAKLFTEQQMDAIIAFYKSPAGMALMDKMPEINQQANQMVQSKILTLQPQVRQMFADFEKTQQPAPPSAPAAPAASPRPAAPTLGPAKPK